ncbi:MAG: hypothetical protein U0K86_07520 [Agathobacter sp.]|nr:hypothetical protein [Agathobacter sp.]
MKENFLNYKGRNPDRIEKVLKIVKLTWIESPDLRLGQLICIASKNTDIFAIEDDDLVNQLNLMRKGN